MTPPSPSVADELSDLGSLATYFKSFSGVATAVSAVFPLAGLAFAPLVPPTAIAVPLALVASIVFSAFLFLYLRDASTPLIRILGTLAFAIGATLAVAYVALYTVYVFEHGGTRVVTGLVLTERAKDLIAKGYSAGPHPADLLATVGYEHPTEAWRFQPLIVFLLTLTYCFGCAAVTGSFFMMMLRNISNDRQARSAAVASALSAGL